MNKNNSRTVIFITGTPGVGKTTLAISLKEEISAQLIKVNDLAKEKGLFLGKDEEKGYHIVDLDALCKEFKKLADNNIEDIIFEGHLSHFCKKPNIVIVLRLHPSILEKRLSKRNYHPSKINENLEAEALGICSSESYQIHGDIVQEIDTTNLTPEELLNTVIQLIEGKKTFEMGKIDFLDWIIN